MGRVTFQTIADRVGVSRMTVPKAFSRPDQLCPALRERSLATADELGYAGPDAAGRALARGRSGLVGIVLTDSPDDAFSEEVSTRFLGAITREPAPRDRAVAPLPASSDDDAPRGHGEAGRGGSRVCLNGRETRRPSRCQGGWTYQRIALRAQPPLTTLRQDLDAKGRATALSLMIALDPAQAGGTVSDSHLTLPTALIIRQSIGAAPGSG